MNSLVPSQIEECQYQGFETEMGIKLDNLLVQRFIDMLKIVLESKNTTLSH